MSPACPHTTYLGGFSKDLPEDCHERVYRTQDCVRVDVHPSRSSCLPTIFSWLLTRHRAPNDSSGFRITRSAKVCACADEAVSRPDEADHKRPTRCLQISLLDVNRFLVSRLKPES